MTERDEQTSIAALVLVKTESGERITDRFWCARFGDSFEFVQIYTCTTLS